MSGQKFDTDKPRFDLVPPNAHLELAKCLTMGAKKYGDRNWENGIAWTKLIASLERHLNAVKRGEDYDPESGLLHTAHVMCNAAMLTEYYTIYPQGDNRPHWYSSDLKIALDIDEVIADFIPYYCKYFNIEMVPGCWDFDPKIRERLASLADNVEFWLNVPRKIDPQALQFEPHCYVTSRACSVEITNQWLEKNGFPLKPVYRVEHNASKAETVKNSGANVFIDDRFENFVAVSNAGICSYLLTAPHNIKYNVGHKRINDLNLAFTK